MSWNIAAECISVIILCIIWIYSKKGTYLPTVKNRIFQGCFLITLCAMVSNILSTLFIYYYQDVPLWLNWFVAIVYFVLTPLMGMIYMLYAVSVVYEGSPKLKRMLILGAASAIPYIILILTNPWTKSVFDINMTDGYTRGPLISSTYIVFYIYCIASVIVPLVGRKYIDKEIFYILVAFPVFAVLVIFFQTVFSTVILSGSAATCALLIIYLHIQNKEISMDSLTGVPNRQEFSDMLALTMRRYPTEPFTVLVVSLRDFRQINNTFGHGNGNVFLKNICAFICSLAPKGSTYRFGGDEFAVFLNGRAPEKLQAFLHALHQRMAAPWMVQNHSYQIRAAVGLVQYPDIADSRESIINALEYSVMLAKKKNDTVSVCMCDANTIDAINRKDQILDILKERIPNGDFEMFYQPIISVGTNTFDHAEALIRLRDENLGYISPAEFIPIAESNGLIVEMTYHVLHKACTFANRLAENSIPLSAIHVNFSALQFSQPNLADKVIEIISSENTPLSSIKIEFTESAVAENLENVITFINQMEQVGVGMGLDDFGTGYSNIATVISLPFRVIKLDRSLVVAAVCKEKSAIAIRNIIRTFKELGMVMVAEGVETKEQLDLMIDCNIDQIQGFYYAKPMPENDTLKFLKEHNC